MDYETKLMQNDCGWFVAIKVPMNNLPGCNVFFWQQVSKYYLRKRNAEKALAKRKGNT